MSRVVDNVNEIQGVHDHVVNLVGLNREPAKPAVVAMKLGELVRPTINDTQELIKNRFLCKQGGLLLVGPTGVGKSSLSMQLMIKWALGEAMFGLQPARPLKSLLIQAENDEGDLAEMRDGVFSGLSLSDDQKTIANANIDVYQENSRVSDMFFQETVKPLLETVKPDLLWIDPVLAYLGGESNSQKDVGAFLRNQLNPVLMEYNCAGIVVHHTNKPYTVNDKKGTPDFAYLGGGSAEWANWSRAILTLQKTTTTNVFSLRAAKRGSRLGWKEADGQTPAYDKTIAHNKEPNTICWVAVDRTCVTTTSSNQAEEVLKHVPQDRPLAKNALLDLCTTGGMGINKARKMIDELVKEERLFVWNKPRAGSQPEKYLARLKQPLDANGKEMFTEMFTTILPREDLRETQK